MLSLVRCWHNNSLLYLNISTDSQVNDRKLEGRYILSLPSGTVSRILEPYTLSD